MKLDGRLNFATIQKLCVLYLIIWCIAPPLMIDNIYRYLGLAACGVWFLLAFLRGFRLRKFHLLCVVFILIVCYTTYVKFGSASYIIKNISYFLLVICFFMKDFYTDKMDELKMLIPLALLIFLVFNIKTASVLLEDSTVARLIVRNDSSTYHYIRSGVGGYGFVYAQVCVFPALLSWVITKAKKKFYLMVGAAWLISFIVVLLKANYSIAVFTVVMAVIILFFYNGNSVATVLFVSILIFVAAMLSILYIDAWRNFLLEVFDGTAVAKKINDLVASSESGQSEGSIASRVDFYLRSIETIFKYPIIGGYLNALTSGHSSILDVCSLYGFFGLYVFCKTLFSGVNDAFMKINSGFVKRVANASLASVFVVAFLDTTPYQLIPPIVLLLSVTLYEIEKSEELNNESIMDS